MTESKKAEELKKFAEKLGYVYCTDTDSIYLRLSNKDYKKIRKEGLVFEVEDEGLRITFPDGTTMLVSAWTGHGDAFPTFEVALDGEIIFTMDE